MSKPALILRGPTLVDFEAYPEPLELMALYVPWFKGAQVIDLLYRKSMKDGFIYTTSDPELQWPTDKSIGSYVRERYWKENFSTVSNMSDLIAQFTARYPCDFVRSSEEFMRRL